jgi:hypothetical protein
MILKLIWGGIMGPRGEASRRNNKQVAYANILFTSRVLGLVLSDEKSMHSQLPPGGYKLKIFHGFWATPLNRLVLPRYKIRMKGL